MRERNLAEIEYNDAVRIEQIATESKEKAIEVLRVANESDDDSTAEDTACLGQYSIEEEIRRQLEEIELLQEPIDAERENCDGYSDEHENFYGDPLSRFHFDSTDSE